MKKKLGLALGSGGALGFAHIGVLKSLEENKIPIDFIAGSSAGAIVGAHYALYKDVNLLEEVGFDFAKEKPFKLFDLDSITDRARKEERIKLFLEEIFRDKRFSDLKIPFSAVTVDLESGEEYVIKKGRLEDAVFASMSVPGVFGPAFFWGKWLVDGGVANPTPISVVKEMGADYVLGIDLTENIKRPIEDKPKSIKTIFRSIEIMLGYISSGRNKEVQEKVVIYPKFKTVADSFEIKNVKSYFEAGYNTMNENIAELKKKLN